MITCLGLIPIKSVLLGDPAMCRPGFNDRGAVSTQMLYQGATQYGLSLFSFVLSGGDG